MSASPPPRKGRLRALKGLPPLQQDVVGTTLAVPLPGAPVLAGVVDEETQAGETRRHVTFGEAVYRPPAEIAPVVPTGRGPYRRDESGDEGGADSPADVDGQEHNRKLRLTVNTEADGDDAIPCPQRRAAKNLEEETSADCSRAWPTSEQRKYFLQRTGMALKSTGESVDGGKCSTPLCGSFPFHTTRHGHSDSWEAAKFLIVPAVNSADPDSSTNINNVHLVRYFLENSWEITRPDVIITVTGGAQHFDLPAEMKDKIMRGMMEGTRHLNPWFITGGTNSGIMKYVGEARAKFNPTAPLIGVSSLGAIAGGEQLRRLCQEGPDSAAWDQEGGKCEAGKVESYDQIVDEARSHGTNTENPLDRNHSHFILVDDGNNGSQAFGCDRPLRAALETCIADTHVEAYPIYKIAVGLKWEKVEDGDVVSDVVAHERGTGAAKEEENDSAREIHHAPLIEALRLKLEGNEPLTFTSREIEEYQEHMDGHELGTDSYIKVSYQDQDGKHCGRLRPVDVSFESVEAAGSAEMKPVVKSGSRVVDAQFASATSALQALYLWEAGWGLERKHEESHQVWCQNIQNGKMSTRPSKAKAGGCGRGQSYVCGRGQSYVKNVCSALQAIWLHCGDGSADERAKGVSFSAEDRARGVFERAKELNDRERDKREVLAASVLFDGSDASRLRREDVEESFGSALAFFEQFGCRLSDDKGREEAIKESRRLTKELQVRS